MKAKAICYVGDALILLGLSMMLTPLIIIAVFFGDRYVGYGPIKPMALAGMGMGCASLTVLGSLIWEIGNKSGDDGMTYRLNQSISEETENTEENNENQSL